MAYDIASVKMGAVLMCQALAPGDAGLATEEVLCINAHGTSTPAWDIADTRAIYQVFGAHAARLAVSSTKSITGHLPKAAGAVEAVISIKSLVEGVIPPTSIWINPV